MFQYGLERQLDDVDGCPNYTRWLLSPFLPHLGDRVLEIGGGIGTYTDLIADGSRRVVTTDIAVNCADRLRRRFTGREDVTVVFGDVLADGFGIGEGFSSVLCMNVLEHITNDRSALVSMRSCLRRSGRLCLAVPWGPFLFNRWDEAAGHYRRYGRTGLGRLLIECGLRVQSMQEMNVPGAFVWWLFGRKQAPNGVGGVRMRRAVDRFGVPVIRAIESVVRPPVGHLLAVVAEPI